MYALNVRIYYTFIYFLSSSSSFESISCETEPISHQFFFNDRKTFYVWILIYIFCWNGFFSLCSFRYYFVSCTNSVEYFVVQRNDKTLAFGSCEIFWFFFSVWFVGNNGTNWSFISTSNKPPNGLINWIVSLVEEARLLFYLRSFLMYVPTDGYSVQMLTKYTFDCLLFGAAFGRILNGNQPFNTFLERPTSAWILFEAFWSVCLNKPRLFLFNRSHDRLFLIQVFSLSHILLGLFAFEIVLR